MANAAFYLATGQVSFHGRTMLSVAQTFGSYPGLFLGYFSPFGRPNGFSKALWQTPHSTLPRSNTPNEINKTNRE
jgi:hypothetical protein